ncbi:outer membrane lipoprotein chaperone LolA [Methylobacter sp.]|uniref:outer membrane lipoprotein chaperone LolA n=1 Tax=Methylobacter sp. TaxID=2051955 RepID=UPI003DA3E17F
MNKMNYLRLIWLLLAFVSGASYAEDRPVRELKAFLSATRTLTADFKQVLINEAGDPVQTSYGMFYLQRPGKFRWDYKKPIQQQIVSSSGKVWFYDPDLEQVTVKKLDQSLGSTPALLLSGEVSLEDNFTMEQQGEDEGLLWVKLVPKNEESGFKYVLIGLNNGSLGGMELSDNFGQLTRIYFSNVSINREIKQDLFQFNAPKGADVFSE